MKLRLLALAASLLLLPLVLPGCANQDPDDFERDDYFGGHGNMINPKHHVPRQVQR